MTTTQLPDKLSDLAELALGDLRKCEADERYEIDMWTWHEPYDGKCVVCLAGSVIAKTLEASAYDGLDPGAFPNATCQKLCALNSMRNGDLKTALEYCNAKLPDGMPGIVDVPFYFKHSKDFYTAIEGIIAMLREHGL